MITETFQKSRLPMGSAVRMGNRRELIERVTAIMLTIDQDMTAHHPSPKVTQSFRLPSELVGQLEQEAKKRGISKTELTELALEAFFGMAGETSISKLAEEVARYMAVHKGE